MADMTKGCETGLQPSRIPGNIGTINTKVMVWQHDPFWARPTQELGWSFSQNTEIQMKDKVSDIIFEVGSAFLRPTFKHHDMFVCTLNPALGKLDTEVAGTPSNKEVTTSNKQVDFVGSPASGVGAIAQRRMKGGDIYDCNGNCTRVINGVETPVIEPSTGKDIFPHQVWKHIGSLLDNRVLIHPSEYQKPLSELAAIKGSQDFENFATLEELQSAPKWDYIELADNGKLSIWPMQITKHSPDLNNLVHWTLEKWTPIWQGQDFFVTVLLGDKNTDDAVDPKTGDALFMVPPYGPYMQYNLDTDSGRDLYKGLSNEAFNVSPKKSTEASTTTTPGADQASLDESAKKSAREFYDWRYKTYILIEIGVNDPNHNYFIELVKGRHPRFLHLGEEWDRPSVEEGASNQDPDSIPFKLLKKCRRIGYDYEHLTCDQLFKEADFKVSVRNHLGRIVVTFEGYEGNPWVIERFDNDPNGEKKIVPMVVPSGVLRIHGGNISCAVNYTPTEYIPSSTIVFPDRQVDTGPDNGRGAVDNDVYMTFSHMGNAVQYTSLGIKEQYFDDPRWLYDKVGYDCDAFLVHEINRNSLVTLPIYNIYRNQYTVYGKGWYNKTPRTEKSWKVEIDQATGLPKPTALKNVMSSGEGAVPSHLKIINASNPNASFPLTLDRLTQGYEWEEVMAIWDVGIEFQAGSARLDPPSGLNALPVDDTFNAKVFENYITPIATSWRYVVLGGGKPFEGSVEPFDISPLVSHITDNWSNADFHSLSHEMKMECYIPIESTSNSNQDTGNTELENLFSLGRKLIALHDKSFYVTVSYWWDTGVGHRYVESNEFNAAGDDPLFNDVLIQMTGIAGGAQFSRSNNKLIMSFNIKDYMSVLENQYIFNSPFFDRVQDVQAVYELAKLAGFADDPFSFSGVDRRPLGYLRKVMNDGYFIGDSSFIYNGEKSRSERYDLPGSYATLANPSMKFQNGETYESAIKKIAQLAGKTIYFDRWGVLRLETPAALSAAFSLANERILFTPVFDFVSTPIVRETNVPNPGGEQSGFEFDPFYHAAHLVYNTLTYQRSVEECVNQIIVMSASNDIRLADGKRTGGFVIEGHTFFDQIWKPESEGFIGYRKPLYQQEGAFGSVEGVRRAISIYAKRKFPPVIMSFETYGVPGLKALDIISLDGNLAYITEISHDLDPSTNRWWMNITAEWLKPFHGELGFLEALEPTTGEG